MTFATPSRLLSATVVIVLLFTVVRFALAASLDLRTDEAYYWTWSHETVLSFLDHPPMVAYFVRFGALFFGDTPFGARFANLLALPITEFLLADIARRRTGDLRAALLVILAIESTVFLAAIFVLVEPSVPLILFASLMLWALARLDETQDSRWWILIGVAGGLALLSKYTAILLVPAILSYVAWPRQNRNWIASAWFWSAGLIALAIFSPVLWWNSRHGWASFEFQGARLSSGGGIDWLNAADYIGNNLGLVGPVLMPTAMIGAGYAGWCAYRRRDPVVMAIVVAFVFPFAYFALRSLTLKINNSWSIFVWPFGITAMVMSLFWREGAARSLARLRSAALISITVGIPMVGLLFYHALAGTAVWFGRQDPIGSDAGYQQLSVEVIAEAEMLGATWIATTDYRTYGALRWHLGRRLPVVQVTERSRFLDFQPPDMAAITGQTGLYVHRGDQPDPRIAAVVAERRIVGKIDRKWRGQVMGTLALETIDGWTPDLDPPVDSPLFQWPTLVGHRAISEPSG